MTRKFKWTEEEFQKVATEMYKLMTSRGNAIVEHWPAFKRAQATVRPMYEYSVNFQNTDLMKELRRRVNVLFADCKNKVEVVQVLTPENAKIKARGLMEKIGKVNSQFTELQKEALNGAIRSVHAARNTMSEARKAAEAGFIPKIATLLTGNTVDVLNHEVDIVITTNCPKKFVIVDLETGQQYSSLGVPVRGLDDSRLSNTAETVNRLQKIVKPVRRVTIPKPKKETA
jgi:hypothetical protein